MVVTCLVKAEYLVKAIIYILSIFKINNVRLVKDIYAHIITNATSITKKDIKLLNFSLISGLITSYGSR
jgi:hypothetical protein